MSSLMILHLQDNQLRECAIGEERRAAKHRLDVVFGRQPARMGEAETVMPTCHVVL